MGSALIGPFNFLGFRSQSSDPSTPNDGYRLFADSLGRLAWKGANGFRRVFDGLNNTADRVYTLPNYSGTMMAYYMIDTYANIVAAAAPPTNAIAKATDIGPYGADVQWNGTTWVPTCTNAIPLSFAQTPSLFISPTGATYSQTGTLVTVTWTGKAPPAGTCNGAAVYLTVSTGAAASGFFTNYTYVDANTFTCVSSVSQTTSGNLASNATVETYGYNSVTMPSWTKDGIHAVMTYFVTGTNSANNKTTKTYYGGVLSQAASVLTTTVAGFITITTGVRWMSPTTFIVVGNTGTTGNGIVNTEANKIHSFSVTMAAAQEYFLVTPQLLVANWRAP